MDNTTFKSFEKASMVPDNMLPITTNNGFIQLFDQPYNLSTCDGNLSSSLVINRSLNNFGHHVYCIYSQNQDTIKKCLKYIKNISGYPLEDDTITDTFDIKKYKDSTLYCYNNIQTNGFEYNISFKLKSVLNISNGIVYISNNLHVPKVITTMANIVFIDPDFYKNIEKISSVSSSIKIPINYKIDNLDEMKDKILCINKTLLWSKFSVF